MAALPASRVFIASTAAVSTRPGSALPTTSCRRRNSAPWRPGPKAAPDVAGPHFAVQRGRAKRRPVGTDRHIIGQPAERKLAPAELPLDTLLDDEDNRDELDDLNDDLELPDAGDREADLAEIARDLAGLAFCTASYSVGLPARSAPLRSAKRRRTVRADSSRRPVVA